MASNSSGANGRTGPSIPARRREDMAAARYRGNRPPRSRIAEEIHEGARFTFSAASLWVLATGKRNTPRDHLRVLRE